MWKERCFRLEKIRFRFFIVSQPLILKINLILVTETKILF